MTEQQFWEATPRELDALFKRWIAREERADRRIASILLQQRNMHRGKGESAMTLDQFLGTSAASSQKQKNPGQLTAAYLKHRDSMLMIHQGLKPPDLPAWALTSTPEVEARKHGR